MKYLYTILLAVACCISINAQKQSNRWNFGRYTGLDFNQLQSIQSQGHGMIHGLPKESRGPFTTNEGCFSISDKEGKFLFSSDGSVAYNRNNVAMPNGKGLQGHPSSAQSGIVVPVPANENQYYLLTAPEVGNKTAGYQYSIVDMTLDNNLGDINSIKCRPLPLTGSGYTTEHCSENLTVVKHTNDIDYWLVAMVWEHFVVWEITKTGISIPKKYLIPNGHKMRAQSTIKFSPDGKKVVYASNNSSKIAFADFDPSNGIMTNMKCTETGLVKTYGIEFSPNGKYVFLTRIEHPSWQNPVNGGLFIRKVEDLGVTAAHPDNTMRLKGITNVQLGPDRRIYAIIGASLGAGKVVNDRNLYVILNPDEGGTDIAELKDFFAADRPPVYGLPPFITSFFSLKGIKGNIYPVINKEQEYEAYLVQGSGDYEIDYLEWDFGDQTPKKKHYYTPNAVTYLQKYSYKEVGDFEMVVKPYNTKGKLMEGSILTKDITSRVGTMIVNPANRSFYRK